MFKKNFLIIVAVLPIILAVGGMIIWKVKASQKTFAGPEITPSTQLEFADNGPKAILTKESGMISYKLPGSSDYAEMTEAELEIPTGTSVKTGEGLAHVLLPDNSLMSMSKNTEVTLNFEETKTSIVQLLGNTWHRVEKVLQGNEYEVQTPNALATVRGTEFNVEVKEDETSNLYTIEGIVATALLLDDGSVSTQSAMITADLHVDMPKISEPENVTLIPHKMPLEKRNSAWSDRNKQMTKMIKEQQKEDDSSEKPAGASESPRSKQEEKILRRDVMEKIKEDENVKKIDEKYKFSVKEKEVVKGISTEKDPKNDQGQGGRPSPTQSSTPTRQTETKKQPTATSVKSSEQTSEVKPTATFTAAPTNTPEPKPTETPMPEKKISYSEMETQVLTRYNKEELQRKAEGNSMKYEGLVEEIYKNEFYQKR